MLEVYESTHEYTGKPASNLASEARVTVSTEIAGYEGVKTADRIYGIYGVYSKNGQDCGERASSQSDPWIRLDWEYNKAINKIVLYDRTDPDNNVNGGTMKILSIT